MKTVIEMAQESGFQVDREALLRIYLEDFAELVRADAIAEEREACAVMAEKEAQYSLAKAIRSRSSERRSKEQQ